MRENESADLRNKKFLGRALPWFGRSLEHDRANGGASIINFS
jgi:hypothetical protein